MRRPVTRLTALIRRALAGVDPALLLLATDFDGTLAEVVAEAAGAQGRPESLRALADLAPRLLAVAVISGRSRAALEPLLAVPGLTLLGDYGLAAPDAAEAAALAEFNLRAAGIVAGLEGVVLEAKPGSTSVHFRGAGPEIGGRLLALLEPPAAALRLRAGRGRMVIEVRPARARKGAAVRGLVARLSPAAVIFAGDDEGDRDAFEYVAGLPLPHLAVGVASAEAGGDLFRSCDAVLDGPAEMGAFLSRLALWAARPGRVDPGADG